MKKSFFSLIFVSSVLLAHNGSHSEYFSHHSNFHQLETSCSNGYVKDCHNLGNMYHNGVNVAQNKVLAKQFYKKACDSGYHQSCLAIQH